jgi:putative sigma-54 modulation protein
MNSLYTSNKEGMMPLKVDIFSQNLEITDRITDYINKKTSKLERLLRDIEETRVDLTYSKSARSASDRHVAQITIRGKGFILRSEERADDIFTAFDASMDKIQRQIERFKGKRARSRSGHPLAQEVLSEEALEEAEPVIARRKKFVLVPMDEMEAIDQMKLLGHENFFIFYNINTNSINVLYKRRSGDYGLIEPEVG